MIMRLLFISFLLFGFTYTNKAPIYNATWYDTAPHSKIRRNHSTAAFNEYPRGTFLLVTNVLNGKSDTVEVTDRHNAPGKHIDLSKSSFTKIANLKEGRIRVYIKKL